MVVTNYLWIKRHGTLIPTFVSVLNWLKNSISLKNWKNFFLIFRHSFGAKFQNWLPEIIKPFVTSPKYALKLAITLIWNYLPEIITPSVIIKPLNKLQRIIDWFATIKKPVKLAKQGIAEVGLAEFKSAIISSKDEYN